MDLKKNDPAGLAEKGFEFELKLPDGNPTDIKITVRGTNSRIVRDHGRKTFHELEARKNAMIKRNKKPEDMTLEEAEDLAIASAVVRVKSWKNIQEDGKDVEFTKENAERIMRTYPFIREAVVEESDNIHNFPFQ